MRNLEQSVADANRELDPSKSEDFSLAGFMNYKDHIDNYIMTLYSESKKCCKRESQEQISAEHVNKAANYIAMIKPQGNLKLRLKEAIGGIFLGAVISNIMSIYVSGVEFTTFGFVSMIVIGAVSTSLLTASFISKD